MINLQIYKCISLDFFHWPGCGGIDYNYPPYYWHSFCFFNKKLQKHVSQKVLLETEGGRRRQTCQQWLSGHWLGSLFPAVKTQQRQVKIQKLCSIIFPSITTSNMGIELQFEMQNQFRTEYFTLWKRLENRVQQSLSTLDLLRDLPVLFISPCYSLYIWFTSLSHVLYFPGCHSH